MAITAELLVKNECESSVYMSVSSYYKLLVELLEPRKPVEMNEKKEVC